MSSRPRLAVITTAYLPNSHADVIVSRWLEPRDTDREVGWPFAGHDRPRTEIASLYIMQFPENDNGRAMAKRHNVPVYDTVREALTLGGDGLAVDGVMLIAEHGVFDLNEHFQLMYPRRELFDEITAVFRECGQSVPVFNDKHLSYDVDSARHMVAVSHELKFPLMAGSSIPLGGYQESMGLRDGADLNEGIGLYYCGVESYGYHSIDFLQSLVARRAGGEAGIESVTAYFGEGFWKAHTEGVWSVDLMEAALKASSKSVAGDYRENLDLASCTEGVPYHPAAFCFRHRDGFKSSHLFLHGHMQDFTVAVLERDGTMRASSAHHSTGPEEFYRHFATLNVNIEAFMLTGRSPYPIEHYLLCTVALAHGVHALKKPGVVVETPDLNLPYCL